ncbi:MAG: hypothetical protein CMJ90_05955 [Planctomycetes bacterium]|nr:hypothetical protein [Planctomycetota bacterium]
MSQQTPHDVGFKPEPNEHPSSRGRLGPYATWPYSERRVHEDRRLSGTRLFSRYMLRGGRLRGRRQGETQNVYVDRYRSGDLALAGAILVLNIFDAGFTLDYLGKGGTEANPIARFLMEQGTGWFVFSKAVVVALCVLFLMMHKTFHFVRPALWALFGFYSCLLVYHIFLQLTVSPVPGV